MIGKVEFEGPHEGLQAKRQRKSAATDDASSWNIRFSTQISLELLRLTAPRVSTRQRAFRSAGDDPAPGYGAARASAGCSVVLAWHRPQGVSLSGDEVNSACDDGPRSAAAGTSTNASTTCPSRSVGSIRCTNAGALCAASS